MERMLDVNACQIMEARYKITCTSEKRAATVLRIGRQEYKTNMAATGKTLGGTINQIITKDVQNAPKD